MTLEELNKQIEQEYEKLIKKGLDWSVEHDENEHVYFVNNAYEYAHYNEIQAYFDNMDDEEYNEDWKELIDECKCTDKILEGVYNDWLDYSHPERYNFFCYEDLKGIIKYWLERN